MSEFVISRIVDAPRDLVFKVWTDPEHLMHWWGPKGFTMLKAGLDLRVGGTFHYGMRTPDGATLWGKWIFLAVRAPEWLEFLMSFSDENGGTARHPFSENWPLELLSSISFDEHDGKTTLTVRGTPYNASDTERAAFDAAHGSLQGGWGGVLDKLDDYLSHLRTSSAA